MEIVKSEERRGKRGTVRSTEYYLRRLPAETRDVRRSDCRRQTRSGAARHAHQNPSPRWGAFRPGPERKALLCAEKAPTWARLRGSMQDLCLWKREPTTESITRFLCRVIRILSAAPPLFSLTSDV